MIDRTAQQLTSDKLVPAPLRTMATRLVDRQMGGVVYEGTAAGQTYWRLPSGQLVTFRCLPGPAKVSRSAFSDIEI